MTPTSLYLKNGKVDNTPIGLDIPREGNFSVVNAAVLSTNQLIYKTKTKVITQTEVYKGDLICDNLYIKSVIGHVYGEIRDGKFLCDREFNGALYHEGILKVCNNEVSCVSGSLKNGGPKLFDVIDYHKINWVKRGYARSNTILPDTEIVLLSGSGGFVMLGNPCEYIKTIVGRNIGSPIFIKELGCYIKDKEIIKVLYDKEWVKL